MILSSRGGKREPFNPPFPLAGQAATEFSPILSRIAASDGSSLFYVFDEIISKERGRVEEREREVGEWELFYWILWRELKRGAEELYEENR